MTRFVAQPVGPRLWPRVDQSGGLEACWPWGGYLHEGYGSISVDGVPRGAHRAAWEEEHGPQPEGTVLDHTCHEPATCAGGPTCLHRRCCNPAHMILTSIGRNTSAERSSRSGQHLPARRVCARGHVLAEVGTYGSSCRRCAIDRAVDWNRKNRGRT